MSTVAFLASVVDPRVAASAAKSAMEEFARIKDEVPTVIMDAHMKNVKESAEEKSDDPVKTSLEKSGIAGTETEKEVEKESAGEDAEKKTDSKDDEKKEEEMEVDKDKEKDDSEKPKEDSKEPEIKKEAEESDATVESEKEKSADKKETPSDRLIKDGQLQGAAAAALSSAAVKAKHLAAVEERKIKSLVATRNANEKTRNQAKTF